MGKFVGDQIIGAIIILCSFCGALCGVAIGTGVGLLGIGGGAAASTASPIAGLGLAALGAGVGILIIVSSVVSLGVGAGILLGKKWGHILGACIYGFLGFGSLLSMGSDGFFSTVLNLALFAYCFCRITGKISPGIPPI